MADKHAGFSQNRHRYLRLSLQEPTQIWKRHITARAKVKGGSFPLPLISGTGSSSSDISLSLWFGWKSSWFARSSSSVPGLLAMTSETRLQSHLPEDSLLFHFVLFVLSNKTNSTVPPPVDIYSIYCIWKPSNTWMIYDHNIHENSKSSGAEVTEYICSDIFNI